MEPELVTVYQLVANDGSGVRGAIYAEQPPHLTGWPHQHIEAVLAVRVDDAYYLVERTPTEII